MIKVMKKASVAAIALMASAISIQAATITSAAGLDLTRNVTQDAAVQVFSEASDVTIGANTVTVDYLVGENLIVGDDATGVSNFSGGIGLTAGVYDSFLIHYDPTGDGDVNNVLVDFGQTIVGIILSNSVSTSLLNVSDSTFGTALAYDDHLGRRSEDTDIFTLTSTSSLSLTLGTKAKHVDNIRVITEITAVPLPATLPLMLAGFFGLSTLRRRSEKT